jgi:hypothetical protein
LMRVKNFLEELLSNTGLQECIKKITKKAYHEVVGFGRTGI